MVENRKGFWVMPMTHEQMEFPWETWETFAKAVIRVQLPLMIPDARQEFNRPMPEQQPLFEEAAYLGA